jgi:hypothetical protein
LITRIVPFGIIAILLAGLFPFLTAADKKIPSITRGENQDLVLDVTLYDDPVLVKDLLGTDLGGHVIVAEVKIDPKFGKDIVVDRDDFQLRTTKDGEHTTPFAPSQIVASDAVVVAQSKGPSAASPGMVIPGPLVIRGGLGAGAPAEGAGDAKAAADGAEKKENPLKKLLEEKVLPEKKTDQAVSGLLYFPMEKQKRKDLELIYGGRENRITLRFK